MKIRWYLTTIKKGNDSKIIKEKEVVKEKKSWYLTTLGDPAVWFIGKFSSYLKIT